MPQFKILEFSIVKYKDTISLIYFECITQWSGLLQMLNR
jgi:hypothetical protein